MTQVLFLFLIVTINVSKISGIALIENISTVIFLTYICVNRQWRLAFCGVLFSILSFAPYLISIPILSQIPALGMLLMVVTSLIIIYPFETARTWTSWLKVGEIRPITMCL